jgi:MFS family permease
MLGCNRSARLADALGRKRFLMLSTAVFVCGAALQTAAAVGGVLGIVCMLLGRLVVGAASGGATVVVPAYLSEIAPEQARGSVGVTFQLVITISMLCAQLAGMPHAWGTERRWPWVMAFPMVAGAVQLACMPLMVESPRWLAHVGRAADAARVHSQLEAPPGRSAYNRVWGVEEGSGLGAGGDPGGGGAGGAGAGVGGGGESSIELAACDSSCGRAPAMRPGLGDQSVAGGGAAAGVGAAAGAAAAGRSAGAARHSSEPRQTDAQPPEQQHRKEDQEDLVGLPALLADARLRPLLALCVLTLVTQQLSGINVAFNFSTVFLEENGVSAQAIDGVTVWMNLVNVGSTLVAAWLVERAGRRSLLLCSSVGMAACAGLITLGMRSIQSEGGVRLATVGIVLFVGAFGIGLGPIPWLIPAELFSQAHRATALGFAAMCNWAANGLVALLFLPAAHALGAMAFVPFICTLCAYTAYATVALPETRGLQPDQA